MSDDATKTARLLDWHEVLDECSYYEILAVAQGDGEPEIKAAYHRFALAFHPDSHMGADAATAERARAVFQRGTEAYRVLIHPELRVRYDMLLERGQLRLDSSNLPNARSALQEARQLHELCRSAGAKLCAQRATRLIDAGDLASAKRELLTALAHDGGANTAIQERIEALDVVLYAMGNG